MLVLAAAGCSGQRPALATVGVLQSVVAVSARDAWAVGRAGAEGCGCGKTLIVHWDGVAWSRVPSPSLAGRVASLSGVAFTSANVGWAVGRLGRAAARCGGLPRGACAMPGAGRVASWSGVAFTSANVGWAVGSVGASTLILRWDGAQWHRVASPTPPGGVILNAVAAVSATSAWAVGSARGAALIEHWNGRTWKQVRGPASSILQGIAAVSANSAWAVGYKQRPRQQDPDPAADRHHMEARAQPHPIPRLYRYGPYERCRHRGQRLGGRRLRLRPAHPDLALGRHNLEAGTQPTPAGSNFLRAVATTPTGGALAVGSAHGGTGTILVEHWDGATWTQAPPSLAQRRQAEQLALARSAGRPDCAGDVRDRCRRVSR